MSDEHAAAGQLMRLIEDGKAEEILDAYSEHMQSCAMIYGIVVDTASLAEPDGDDPVQTFARNLLDEWGK